jgi:hypothetical protein
MYIVTFQLRGVIGNRTVLFLFPAKDLRSAIRWAKIALPPDAGRAELLGIDGNGWPQSIPIPVAGVSAARLWRKHGLQRFRMTAFRDSGPLVFLVLAADSDEASAHLLEGGVVSHWDVPYLPEEEEATVS